MPSITCLHSLYTHTHTLSLFLSLSHTHYSEIESLTHAMNLVNSVDKLIEACEAPRTIRMPRTVMLVKQLKKELNFSDIVKSMRKKGERDITRTGMYIRSNIECVNMVYLPTKLLPFGRLPGGCLGYLINERCT